MGKKLKLPFLFSHSTTETRSSSSSSSSWPWPSCNQPRTLSFRSGDIFRTINSAYLAAETHTPDSWFSASPASASFSASSAEEDPAADLSDSMIRGLRSERLFFEPGETSSILDEAKPRGEGAAETATFKESLAMSVESREPVADFRRSMEEMVAAHRLDDWDSLEELLTCYLKVNGKHNHDYIVGAFVDLLVGLAAATAVNRHHRIDSPVSPLFLCTSSESSEHSASSTTINASADRERDRSSN